MPQQTGGSQRSRPRAYIDSSRLKTLVYELSREHARLHPYLVKVGAAAGALVADPQSSVSKVKAREAWQELVDLIEHHMSRKEDEQLLQSAEALKLLPETVAKEMLEVCERLKGLEHRISAIDLEHSPTETIVAAGDAMRNFAVILDDLSVREDRELLPPLRKILYRHELAPKR